MAEPRTWAPGRGLDAAFNQDLYVPVGSEPIADYQHPGFQQAATNIRTVLPSELLNRKTPEEEQAEYDKEIERQSREADLANKKLKQKSDLDKITYDKNIAMQGNDFLKEIKNLNPGDPDYALHKAALIERMPLAVQHESVKYQLSTLDKTDESLRQNRAAVEEHKRATGVTQKQQDLTKARDWAAQKGARYLNQFQETLKNNPDADPVSVIAQIVDAQEEQKSISELRRHEIPDEEINKFRIPEVDAGGKLTGRTIYDKDAADNYLKTFPTTSNVNATMGRAMQLRKDLAEAKTNDPDSVPKIQAYLDITDQMLEKYNQKLGEGKTKKDIVPDRSADKAPATANLRFKSKPAPTTAENEAALKEQQAAQATYNW